MRARSTGKLVGEDVTCGFLDRVGGDVLVRGHECFEEGFHFYGDRSIPLDEEFNHETL